MSRLLLSSVLAMTLFGSGAAQSAPETFVLDPNHTNITWHANHFGFSNPSGKFATTEGKLVLDEDAPQNSSVEVTVKMGSVLTGIEKFDAHLKSPDFFDVEKFPEAKFTSKKVEVTGDKTAKIEGELTMLGVTKPLTLNVTLNKIGPHPMTGKKTVGFSATGTIKRSEYGMGFALPAVSDDVPLNIEVEGNIE